jgi:hypothetical protein
VYELFKKIRSKFLSWCSQDKWLDRSIHSPTTINFYAPDWMTDYNGLRLCLRTAATNGPIVHPPADMWAWRSMVVMMSAADNAWLVRPSSLAVVPAETSGASRRNGRRSENFAYQYLKYLKGSLTCRKISRHRTSGFTSQPKEGVLWIFIASAVFEPATLGSSGRHTKHYTTEATICARTEWTLVPQNRCLHRSGKTTLR